MRYVEKRVSVPSGNDWHYLTVLSDLHLGNPDAAVDELQALIKERRKLKNHHFALLGDNGDCIVPSDLKRYQASRVIPRIMPSDDYARALVEYQLDVLRDARPLDLVVTGNHESVYLKRHHIDLVSMFAALHPDKPAIGGMCGMLSYVMSIGPGQQRHHSYSVNLLYHHGAWYGQARIPPGALRWAHESAEGWDVFLFGHNHRAASCVDAKFHRPERGGGDEMLARDVQVCACGSHLRGYQTHDSPGYAEERGHAPTPIGAPLIRWRRATTQRHELQRVTLSHNRPEIHVDR